jgi:thiol-disulfide isomerase/thioredoxin
MTEQSSALEIFHITTDGMEIDEKTKIVSTSTNKVNKESSQLLRLFMNKKKMFIKFYATWCGHCRTIDGPWKALVAKARTNFKDKNIAIVEVESKVVNKEIDQIIAETAGLKVDGFPTIGTITYDASGKAKFTTYQGERTTEGMFSAVQSLTTMKGGRRTNTKRSKRSRRTRRTKHTKKSKRTKNTRRK